MKDNLRMSDAQLAMRARRSPAVRRSLSGWLAARFLGVVAAVLRRFPDRLLHRVAHAAGGVLYRLQPARRRLVRDNLQRVCRYLAEHDMAGPAAAAAAHDGQALDRLVRAAFGHYVRGYLEGAILPVYGDDSHAGRVRADDPDLAAQAFPAGRLGPTIIVGMHFGAIEVPALFASRRLGARVTAPMETIADPQLQAYFERTRGRTGINVVPLEGAAAELRGALGRGETVALVADRPVGGSGTAVELFGAPARLPAGPAVLALESDAPVWVIATRRSGWGEYRSRFERLEMLDGDSRRERLAAFMSAEARAFERAVADAPEQWWTVFFPIWDQPRTAR
jgi:KDO2-lipid IV(A) lauroyltransferase